MSAGAPLYDHVRRVGRALLALVPAFIVALPCWSWAWQGTRNASFTSFGRDQGIFQYVAWAITHGDVDYRDVRDVNGPLIHLIHVVFGWFCGRSEHQFRVLDLQVTGVTFAIVGACLPGLTRRPWKVEWTTRLAWAAAAWVALSAQHLMYTAWDMAQRESFLDWFLLPSVGLQLVAQREGKPNRALLILVGALSAIPWFGKPTYIAFTAAQALTLVLDREGAQKTWTRLWPFALGCVLGASTQLAFLVTHGDLRAFAKIYFVDVPAMYRFMMPRTPAEIMAVPWGGVTAALSFVTSGLMLGLIWDRQMPKRLLAIALLPLVGFATVVAQGKGFPYHFHPVTAGLHLQWLTLVVWVWERFRGSATRLARFLPLAAAAALSARIAVTLPTSSHVDEAWVIAKGQTEELRAGEDYLVYFKGPDFFPWEMRQAAAYLREHTQENDRVQIYGMDAYLLFLAERKSATPYIYAYDLDADGALFGSTLPTGLHPTDAQAAIIRGMRDDHETDLLARVQKTPPSAFVFMDKAPLMAYGDAVMDFQLHCARASAWVSANYRETAAFGGIRVWLRNDLAGVVAGSEKR